MASQQPLKPSQRHPAWSDESSETEYTSSESEEAPAQEKGNWAESQLTDGPRCGTPPIEAALAPSTAPRNISLKKVFIDLGDSDEEIDQPVQDLVVLEVRTLKAKLVVDLSGDIWKWTQVLVQVFVGVEGLQEEPSMLAKMPLGGRLGVFELASTYPFMPRTIIFWMPILFIRIHLVLTFFNNFRPFISIKCPSMQNSIFLEMCLRNV